MTTTTTRKRGALENQWLNGENAGNVPSHHVYLIVSQTMSLFNHMPLNPFPAINGQILMPL